MLIENTGYSFNIKQLTFDPNALHAGMMKHNFHSLLTEKPNVSDLNLITSALEVP
ncbi:hypothetical protein PITCH_A960012 [uncultured Desulfobacterium sp.]|uniref:Uncharacterized protein n=1 Tax=uncultured Desulfobacterium sp. TaxID=201089 RepID=A0A445N431_9BACT|nr:hypothetical protein PITCH_A960012 [uncultured Desulfobacterium sp.]